MRNSMEKITRLLGLDRKGFTQTGFKSPGKKSIKRNTPLPSAS